MINQQILDYVRQQLAAGILREEITKALVIQGWSQQDVNAAFVSVVTPVSPPVPTPTETTQKISNNPIAPFYKSKKFLIAGIIILVVAIGGSVLYSPEASVPNTQTTDIKSELTALAPKESIEFEKQFEISADLNATPRGFIDSSNDGQHFWVADGKLAYAVTYFGANNGNRGELYYDGRKVSTDDLITNETVTGVPEITDRLSFYTFNIDKFFFGDEVVPKKGSVFSAQSIGGKLALVSQSGFTYGGQTIEADYQKIAKIYNVGEKIATVKFIDKGGGKSESVLMWDGKEYAKGACISEVVDFNGKPAYIDHDSCQKQTKAVVMYEGQKVSKEYPEIRKLSVVGGKLAFLAQKKSYDDGLGAGGMNNLVTLDKLVWNEKDYGTEYENVRDYIDNFGAPLYIAENNLSLREINPDNEQYIVSIREGAVILTGKLREGIEFRRPIDVNGYVAFVVQNSQTKNSYVYYAGKKFFEGYDIYSLRNLDGKLAVLATKDKTQYVFMEK